MKLAILLLAFASTGALADKERRIEYTKLCNLNAPPHAQLVIDAIATDSLVDWSTITIEDTVGRFNYTQHYRDTSVVPCNAILTLEYKGTVVKLNTEYTIDTERERIIMNPNNYAREFLVSVLAK